MSPSSSEKADNGEASDSSPEMIQYINQVFRDAETLNKKMRDLLSVVTTETFTPGDAKAWGKMSDVINELAKKCSSIASMPVQPGAEEKEEKEASASSPTTTTPKKRRAHIEPSSGKRRKMAVVPVEARTKRRFSSSSEGVEGDTKKKKRFKRNHREGSERPGLAGGKRKGREEVGREDVGLKRPRNGYFQDGDPPMEYEESSDEGGNGDEKPESVPVVLSSDEDEEC